MEVTPLTYEILLALADEDRHGYGMIKEIEGCGGTAVSTGAMYLALHRMQDEGLVTAAPPPPDNDDARRRYYSITELGRDIAARESERLVRLVATARTKRILTEDAA